MSTEVAPEAAARQDRAAHLHQKSQGLARSNALRAAGFAVSVVGLAVAVLLSLLVGARSLDPMVVVDTVINFAGTEEQVIIRESRWPRTLVGLVVGPALGVCGALIQAFTRNPLADPGILGVNAGASFMVTVAVAFLGLRSAWGFVWFALLGAFALTVVVYAIGSVGRERATPAKLTLAGVAISAVLGGLTSAIVIKNRETLDVTRFWGVGSLGGREPELVILCGALIALGLLIGVGCARPLNAMGLGDELAASLGVRIGAVRIAVVVSVTLLAGSAVALAGPIGFVGLMVPHVVRWFVGPDQRWILALTVVIAPIILLLADVVGRVILPSGELRAGLVTALVGAPVLIVLARRTQVSGL